MTKGVIGLKIKHIVTSCLSDFQTTWRSSWKNKTMLFPRPAGFGKSLYFSFEIHVSEDRSSQI